MARNILFSAGIVLVVLSLFLPWFAVTYNTEYMVREGLYDDGAKVDTEISYREKYYLDRETLILEIEVTDKDETENTYGGNSSYHREGMEGRGYIDVLSGFLYSFYKIMFVVIILSFIIVILEGFGNEGGLDSMKTGIALLLIIILLTFLVGIRDSYVTNRESHVMAQNNNAGSVEYVNMSLPVGFNKLDQEDAFTQYYEVSNFTYEEIEIEVAEYNNTNHGAYITLYGGPDPDLLQWDNLDFSADSSNTYSLWFHKDSNSSAPSIVNETKAIKVDISDLANSPGSASLIRSRMIQALSASPAFDAEISGGANTMKVQLLQYGNVDSANRGNYWGGNVNVITEGSTVYEPVTGDRIQKINWYPSTGFVVSLLGFVCFIGSRFED